MTDETKGDGMTLEQALQVMNKVCGYAFNKAYGANVALKVIKKHLASQSAMRVDEAMARKLGDEYFRLCKLHGDKPMAHGFWTAHLFAALQAAIGNGHVQEK